MNMHTRPQDVVITFETRIPAANLRMALAAYANDVKPDDPLQISRESWYGGQPSLFGIDFADTILANRPVRLFQVDRVGRTAGSWMLTKTEMVAGLRRLNERFPVIFADIVNGKGDAQDGKLLVQASLFGLPQEEREGV